MTDAQWPAYQAVREWLTAAGFPVADQPTVNVPARVREMTLALIDEEAAELRAAVRASDLIEIADGIADLLWVTLEAAATFGIPIEPVFEQIRRSNWTKIETDRVTVDARGKIIGGPDFSPPDLRRILAPSPAPDEAADTALDVSTPRGPASLEELRLTVVRMEDRLARAPEAARALAAYREVIDRFEADLGDERDVLLSRGAALMLVQQLVGRPGSTTD